MEYYMGWFDQFLHVTLEDISRKRVNDFFNDNVVERVWVPEETVKAVTAGGAFIKEANVAYQTVMKIIPSLKKP